MKKEKTIKKEINSCGKKKCVNYIEYPNGYNCKLHIAFSTNCLKNGISYYEESNG
jgi:hypothetical protein